MTSFMPGDRVTLKDPGSPEWAGMIAEIRNEVYTNSHDIVIVGYVSGGSGYVANYSPGANLRFSPYRFNLVIPRLTEDEILSSYSID